jgi:transketolase
LKKINHSKNCYLIRKRILDISQNISALHVGGSFSSVELIEAIYFNFLEKKKKDIFILSKGHAGILQYVVLEMKKILKKKDLDNYCKSEGFLGVHPDYGNPGIHASTGSLGHGLGIAAGIALGNKNKKNVYVIISDGELTEGSTWEIAISAAKLKLTNLILIVDSNDYQSSEKISESHPNLYPIDKKFKNFGWETSTCDGHNTSQIIKKIKSRKMKKPFVLIGKTTKGYPVSFMKNIPKWHYRSPDKLEYSLALEQIKKKIIDEK